MALVLFSALIFFTGVGTALSSMIILSLESTCQEVPAPHVKFNEDVEYFGTLEGGGFESTMSHNGLSQGI